jgi:hypothetical protein
VVNCDEWLALCSSNPLASTGSAVPDYLSVAAPLVTVCDVIDANVCED